MTPAPDTTTELSSKGLWALTCSLLSLSGFVFLCLVGILVQVQPEYMKINKNVESAASIFESACLYGTLLVVSSVVYYTETRKTGRKSYDLSGATSEERQSLLDRPKTRYS